MFFLFVRDMFRKLVRGSGVAPGLFGHFCCCSDSPDSSHSGRQLAMVGDPISHRMNASGLKAIRKFESTSQQEAPLWMDSGWTIKGDISAKVPQAKQSFGL